MKKIIAIIISISMVISSMQIVSFANGNEVSNSSHQCFDEGMVEREIKKCLKDKGISKKSREILMKLFDALKEARKIKDETGIDYSEAFKAKFAAEVAAAVDKKSFWGRIYSWVCENPFWGMLFYSILYQYALNYYQQLKTRYKAGKIETAIDPVTTMGILDTMMLGIKGQENAKKQIRSLVLNIVDKNAQYAANPNKKSKKAGPGATVIYMVGPSGVGKSFSADIIRKVLSGFVAEPFVIEASDIDKQSATSPSEQLFGMRKKQLERGGEIYEYSPVITRIKAIPKSVVIINEYDKMQTPEFDEKLRTIIDQGYINVNGEKIDCTAATFIITSNESSGSVHKGNLESDNVDDGTGSRTFINHDKAFLNRVKLVEFNNLSASEYKEIAMLPFKQLIERYKQQYKIEIDINGTIDSIAQKVADLNKGARPIFDYVDRLNDKLLNEVVLNNLHNNNEEIKYKVLFDKDKEEFILERIEKDSVHSKVNVA